MRHSIVHTASTISLPDSQKVLELNNFGDKTICLDNQFIFELARKIHPLIKECTLRVGTAYLTNLKPDTPVHVKDKIQKLFKVTSPCNVWLR